MYICNFYLFVGFFFLFLFVWSFLSARLFYHIYLDCFRQILLHIHANTLAFISLQQFCFLFDIFLIYFMLAIHINADIFFLELCMSKHNVSCLLFVCCFLSFETFCFGFCMICLYFFLSVYLVAPNIKCSNLDKVSKPNSVQPQMHKGNFMFALFS